MTPTKSLFEICKEYVHWVLVAQDCGGGYLANQKRVELHGELADYFEVDEKALDSILLFLDTEIGFPVNFIISSAEAIDAESTIYGKKLMCLLEKKFGAEKKRALRGGACLDLFSGAGGASKGLLDAGFKQVTGVDIKNQPEYVKHGHLFICDAFQFLKNSNLGKFDFIWASPPCQAYSIGTKGWRNNGKKYPDLIGKTRKMLLKTGKPFVIENVVGAPLRKDLLLCGEMFGLPIIRHRIFEIHGFKCEQPTHQKHKRCVSDGTIYNAYWIPTSKYVKLKEIWVRTDSDWANTSIISIFTKIASVPPQNTRALKKVVL